MLRDITSGRGIYSPFETMGMEVMEIAEQGLAILNSAEDQQTAGVGKLKRRIIKANAPCQFDSCYRLSSNSSTPPRDTACQCMPLS